ncbi:hypothetical protein ACSBR2_022735 [Camellia fascicularis]
MAQGGWIPVVKQGSYHMNHHMRFEDRRAGLFTLFVDNLLESMNPRKMHDLFIKFDVVKDVFIPNKRRKSSNTRFGFVRYDCSIAARVAEHKANGLWVDDKSLAVKIAEYGTRMEKMKKVINGSEPRCTSKKTIRVEELGNGWLFESMILRLKLNYSVLEVRKELKTRGMLNVLVREGGGRDVILTFNSMDELLSKKASVIEWFHEWCEYITEWRSGMHLQQERHVWISCYGVPLNLWNSDTFRKIGGMWGELVYFDGDISTPKSFQCGRIKIVTSVMDPISTSPNLECKGRVFPIRAFEEQNTEAVTTSCEGTTTIGAANDGCSKNHGILSPIQDTSLKKVDDDKTDEVVKNGATSPRFNERNDLEIGGSWSHASAMEETQDCVGNSNEGTCAEAPFVGNNYSAQLGEVAPSTDDQLPTPGFIKSLSEPLQVGPSINLEVTFGLDQPGLQPIDTISGHQPIGPSGKVSQPFRPVGVGLNHTLSSENGAGSSRGAFKGSMSRPTAISYSSQHTGTKQSHSGTQEAQATLQLGHNLGIDFKGQESVILKKLTLIEEKDKERLGRGNSMVE